jgi:hypothetical protein
VVVVPVGSCGGEVVGGAVDGEGGGAFVVLGVEGSDAVGCEVGVPCGEGLADGFEEGVEGGLSLGW